VPEPVPVPSARGRRRRTSPRIRGAPRKKTIAVKSLTPKVLAAGWLELGGEPARLPDRPRTWGECRAAVRGPCPYVGCRHHLYLDIDPDTGSITLNHPDLEPWELPQTCSLHVAERGGVTLEEVGDILNVTRERARQIEVRALTRKVMQRTRDFGIDSPLG
jgi:hypothetical protein